MNQNIDAETLASVFTQRPNSMPITIGEQVVSNSSTTPSFAFTIVSSSFTQGANPLLLEYTNTTLWCGPTREEATPLIERALAAVEENGGDVLEEMVEVAGAPAPASTGILFALVKCCIELKAESEHKGVVNSTIIQMDTSGKCLPKLFAKHRLHSSSTKHIN